MTDETVQTETQPANPAAPVVSTAPIVSEAPAETTVSTASAEAPVAVVEQAAPAPSAIPDVPVAEEFQAAADEEPHGLVTEYTEDGDTPPVASRPCYAGPAPDYRRGDVPGRA